MPPSQCVPIADDRFREYLKEEIPEAFDSEDQLNVDHPAVKSIIDLSVPSLGISSLDGIEFFPAITGLYCDQNELTHLDLTENTQLKRVWCSSNRLRTLKVSQNANMQTLDCSFNRLTQLDLGENTNLRSLYCQGNMLKSLNLFGVMGLSELLLGVCEEVDGRKKNPIVRLQINDVMKTHDEIKNAKFCQDRAIYISTYKTDGTLLCVDYDPLSERCLMFPRLE